MLNRAEIIGHLGGDPEIRAMNNGDRVVNFSVATSEKWKDRNTGEQKEATEWHRIVVWTPGLVDVCEKYLRKGARVWIEGKLRTRKWTHNDGTDRWSTEIVLSGYNCRLLMLDRRGDGRGPPPSDENPYEGQGGGRDLDDEIPF